MVYVHVVVYTNLANANANAHVIICYLFLQFYYGSCGWTKLRKLQQIILRFYNDNNITLLRKIMSLCLYVTAHGACIMSVWQA